MNRSFMFFITIVILGLCSMNFVFLDDSFGIVTQADNNAIILASTNDTFTESIPTIPPSALYEKDTSIISSTETSQEAQDLQRNESFIENVIKSKSGENKNSSTASTTTIDNSTLSQFNHIRNNYLSQWEALPFQSNFATFINEDLNNERYGVFTERNSNIFNPDERISLYLEPIGFKHKPIIDSKGAKLYLTNITTIITMQDDNGNEVPSIEDLNNYKFKSHNKITELFLPIDVDLVSSLPSGNYSITYSIIDEISKQNFDLQKNITIS